MDNQAKQAEIKPALGALALEGFDSSEDDLLDMISSLEDRLGDVRELQQERLHLEDELDAMRKDLEAREAELEEREQTIEDSSTEIFTERELVKAQKREMHDEIEQLETHRRELEAKEQQVALEFENAQSLRAQLQAADEALQAERKKREAEADAIRHEQEQLAQREKELAAHNASNETVTPEMADLAAQLAESQKLATERAKEAEARAEEAKQKALQMEARCRDLTSECEVVRSELDHTRTQVHRAELELPKKLLTQQIKLQNKVHTQRTIITAASWICAALAFGAATLAGFNGAGTDAGLMLGVAFAAYFVGAQAIAGKLLDPPTLVIGAIGGTFGLWFPLWSQAVEQAMTTWAISLGNLPEAMTAQLPVAISVTAAGMTMAIGIFALTWSGRLFFQIGAVSLLVGGLALFPASTMFAFGAGAVLWHAVTGSGLARWASSMAQAETGLHSAQVTLPKADAENFRVM